MITQEYLDYIHSDVWQALRSKRLKIDGYRCQRCHRPFNLQVHHLQYPEVLGTEDPYTDLITLCEYCHEDVENNKRNYDEERRQEWQRKHDDDLQTIKSWCEIKSEEDLSNVGKGTKDFCNMDVIKDEFDHIMKSYNVQMGYISRINSYFRNRRYEVILDMMARGYTQQQVIKETGFSYNMVHKVYNRPLNAKTLIEKGDMQP